MFEFKLKELCSSSLPLVIQKRETPYYQRIHLHDAIELVYIERGSGWCAVNGIIHPMLTGDLYIIPVGATHEYFSESNLHYINILFDHSIFDKNEEELYRKFNGLDTERMLDKYTFGIELQKKMVSRIDELNKELFSNEPYNLLRAKALFIELIIFIFRNAVCAPGIQASHAQKHLCRVLNYITEHLDAKLSLEHLAEVSGYKPDYFGKLFRREVGIGISEYVCNKRIEYACYELSNSEKSIDTIALEYGFFDTSYFIKMFKRYFNCTPLQYRKKYTNK
jgi:AraC-like DNA-binding protein